MDKCMTPKRSRTGFSILEMLVVLGIILIAAGMGVTAVTSMQGDKVKLTAQQLRLTMIAARTKALKKGTIHSVTFNNFRIFENDGDYTEANYRDKTYRQDIPPDNPTGAAGTVWGEPYNPDNIHDASHHWYAVVDHRTADLEPLPSAYNHYEVTTRLFSDNSWFDAKVAASDNVNLNNPPVVSTRVDGPVAYNSFANFISHLDGPIQELKDGVGFMTLAHSDAYIRTDQANYGYGSNPGPGVDMRDLQGVTDAQRIDATGHYNDPWVGPGPNGRMFPIWHRCSDGTKGEFRIEFMPDGRAFCYHQGRRIVFPITSVDDRDRIWIDNTGVGQVITVFDTKSDTERWAGVTVSPFTGAVGLIASD